jgi:hypothetical protein
VGAGSGGALGTALVGLALVGLALVGLALVGLALLGPGGLVGDVPPVGEHPAVARRTAISAGATSTDRAMRTIRPP